MKNIITNSMLLQMNVEKVRAPSGIGFHEGLGFAGDAGCLPAHRLGTPRFAHDVVDGCWDGGQRDDDGDGIELEVHRGSDPQHHPNSGAHLGNPTGSLFACHTVLLFDGFEFGLVAPCTPTRNQCVRRYSELLSEKRLITKGYIIHSDYVYSIADYTQSVKLRGGAQKKSLFKDFFWVLKMIKKFSFLLSPKTWFESIVSPGSLAVLIGAASPHFCIFAGGLPRRRRRRNAFGLIQEYCTTKEIASFEGSPRFARRLICIGFSGQKRIRDFERRKENFLILNPKTL